MTRADSGSSAVVCASADRARIQLSEHRCVKSVTKRATRERAAIVTREMEGAVEMMATTTTKAMQKESRDIELTRMLEGRRRTLLTEVQGKIRDGRRDFTKEREVLDECESSEVDIQDEIEFALLQLKAETLHKIDVALRWLDEGTYGQCFECGDQIAEARLRALPFAVRCRDCEEARETAELRERLTQRRGSSTLFVNMLN